MLSKLEELGKLFAIYSFIASQAIKSVRGSKRSSHLLTELYLDALGEQSRLERMSLGELFPGLEDSVISIFGKNHPYLTEGFHEREALTSSNETCALAAIAKHLAPRHILEIGTARGGTTLQFVLNAPAATVFTLDIESPKIENVHIQQCFASDRIKVITADSKTFDFASLATDFDLIFIDGGHDAETVLSDSQNALKLVSKNGVVLWHDYKPSFPGVFDTLNELSSKVEIRHIWGTSLAIHQNK